MKTAKLDKAKKPSTPKPSEESDEDDYDDDEKLMELIPVNIVYDISKTAEAISELIPKLVDQAVVITRVDKLGIPHISRDTKIKNNMKNFVLSTLMGFTVSVAAVGNMARVTMETAKNASTGISSHKGTLPVVELSSGKKA
ncbi:hypothetical protein CDAR_502821 [Caerostris darwini]|uniref:Uncharacterized protein n=1 Tax=Caerostris darwini TaxID=1538125 RepID=A0AAV4QER7_9ARAC|nr:hypothetical protein CDAR_502821 [Caerostris darwini]